MNFFGRKRRLHYLIYRQFVDAWAVDATEATDTIIKHCKLRRNDEVVITLPLNVYIKMLRQLGPRLLRPNYKQITEEIET
jgi:hypothetical protein